MEASRKSSKTVLLGVSRIVKNSFFNTESLSLVTKFRLKLLVIFVELENNTSEITAQISNSENEANRFFLIPDLMFKISTRLIFISLLIF